MKKLLLHLVLLLFVLNFFQNQDANAQAGMWTWVNGDSIPNSPGVFGVQGVPSPLNHPPALYEPCEWTDLQGNFWLFGGVQSNIPGGNYNSDLWKYDPNINQWTWIKGPGIPNSYGNYGIQGIPSLSNMPPARSWGIPTWVDLSGDLWMYGGHTCLSKEPNDLWKYNIASNTWTWMQGSSVSFILPVYGIVGVANANNTPGSRAECNATWVDNNNNLWLFGGQQSQYQNNDLWKYDPAVNQWTWMKGANLPNQPGHYGTKGIPNQANVPGARFVYCHWKDSTGNFWLFGGSIFPGDSAFNDMWMYNPLTNNWTWMSGKKIKNNDGHFGTPNSPSILNLPPARFENRCFWTDVSGNFWLYGGGRGNFQICYGDLWRFNPYSLEWTFVSGDSVNNLNPIYGMLGVPSILNKPGARGGSIGWIAVNSNSLFLFGGASYFPLGQRGDLWRFELPSILNTPIINFQSSDTTFCEKNCINFFDLSTNNPTSWQWYFPGASPDTSTLQNPTNICYNTYGNYDVTLVACNGNGCDSLHLTNFITCFQNPVDSIYQSNDTLYSLPAFSYQWYETTSGIIAGATNQYYVLTQPGSYFCVVSDSVGCVASSNTITITGLTPGPSPGGEGSVVIVPNPNSGKFEIVLSKEFFQTLKLPLPISISDMHSKIVFQSEIKNAKTEIDISKIPNGIYSVSITTNKGIITKRIEVIH